MAPARRGQRGVTLLEVLVTIGVLTILLAVGVPNLVALRAPYALDGAVRRVTAGLQLARMKAISRNTRYRVTFDAAAGTYTPEEEVAPNVFVADPGPQPIPQGATLGTVTPADPIFDSRGMLAAGVVIPITAVGGRTKVLTTNVLGHTTIN